MQQLNNVVPALYENAYNRWLNQGSELYNRYSLTQSLANDEYGKYRDKLSDYWQNVSYAKSNADAAYNKALNDRNWQYQLERDAVSDRQQARENMLESMAIGYVPDYEYAQMVGMAPAELDAWLAYIAEQNKPKYSGGGSGSDELPVSAMEFLSREADLLTEDEGTLYNSVLAGKTDLGADWIGKMKAGQIEAYAEMNGWDETTVEFVSEKVKELYHSKNVMIWED